jgi:catalase
MRLALGMTTIALLSSLVTGTASADDEMPEKLVDALNAVFGKHGARASHAKGICVTGDFVPSAAAKDLTKRHR